MGSPSIRRCAMRLRKPPRGWAAQRPIELLPRRLLLRPALRVIVCHHLLLNLCPQHLRSRPRSRRRNHRPCRIVRMQR